MTSRAFVFAAIGDQVILINRTRAGIQYGIPLQKSLVDIFVATSIGIKLKINSIAIDYFIPLRDV